MAWGDSFVSGLATGGELKDRLKRRKLEELEQQLKLDMQAKELSSRKEIQEKDLASALARQLAAQGFQAGEGEKDRGHKTNERLGSQNFQSGEGEKDRGFRTGERVGSQEFHAGQSDLDRAARAYLQNQELGQRKTIADAELAFKNKEFNWQTDPKNPYNSIRDAQAAKLMSDMGDFGSVPPVGGQFGGGKKGPREGSVIEQDGIKYRYENGAYVPLQ